MANVMEAIGSYLQTNNFGTLGTNIFYGRMQDSPDVQVTIYEYEGGVPYEAMGASGTVVDVPKIQIVTRGTKEDYAAARDTANAIRASLSTISNQTLSGIQIMRVQPQGSVMPLGYDPDDRAKFAVNFRVFVGV
jgi:hypothetical protein